MFLACSPNSKIAVTTDIYGQVASASTQEALRRLGEKLNSGPASGDAA